MVSANSADPTGRTYTFALSEKGKAQTTQWRRDGQGIDMPVARKLVREVTGIVQEADGNASGEFTWQWEPTFPHIQVASDLLPGKAHFRRYDDGWRLQEVSLGHSPTNEIAS